MWGKIFFTVMAITILVMAFFTYYSWSWLQSIGNPAVSAEGYVFHASLAWTVLWASALVLLFLGNAVMWTSGRSWAVWTTLFYFAVFIVIRYFWLGQEFFYFTKDNNLSDKLFSLNGISGVVVLGLAATIVYFDQFMIIRLRSKTHGRSDLGSSAGEETSSGTEKHAE